MEFPWNSGNLEPWIFCVTDPVTESNCYVIRQKEDCLVIDPNSCERLEQLFQKWNMRPSLILLTHEHCDHIGGLNGLRAYCRAPVAASRACSLGIQNAKENMSRMMEMFLYYKSGEKILTPYAPFTCGETELQFDGELTLLAGTDRIHMKSLPGHTRGSSVIRYERHTEERPAEAVIFCGDYLLPGEPVQTRLPGGSKDDYERYAKPWLREIPDGTWIFPGHGEAFQMSGEVRRCHDL